jgi:hypothetical protein
LYRPTPLLSIEATGVYIPIGNTEMFLSPVYKSSQRLWSDTDITKLLGFANKSILAGNLNAKQPVWISKVSNVSGLKLLKLFVNSNFEISAPQCPLHYTPDILNIVIHQNVQLSEVILTDILDSDHLPIMFSILDSVRSRGALDPVEKLTDWEMFQNLTPEHVSPNIQIHSSDEADKAAQDLSVSTASAYRLSTRKATILGWKYEIPGLDKLLKHERQLRKLWQETKKSNLQKGSKLGQSKYQEIS